MSCFGLGRNQRTSRPKKSAPSGSKGAQLLAVCCHFQVGYFISGSTVLKLLISSIRYEYRWADGVQIKRSLLKSMRPSMLNSCWSGLKVHLSLQTLKK
ncbi:hypothetical protein OPV22_011959 [Ensete ventricosum]|uniref:Uncharacterized protein n=1 Tax=Ensete ventricosum TaxID=4639 RepID=A0AAV8PH04_ENSVE|nr:hypothetical protein OPV22_011959 [Ensete ventricosum]